jgi:hypothetical protein
MEYALFSSIKHLFPTMATREEIENEISDAGLGHNVLTHPKLTPRNLRVGNILHG